MLSPLFARLAGILAYWTLPSHQTRTCEDFTQIKDFDGLSLAARCLVRLCESGNLTVAAELIQAAWQEGMPCINLHLSHFHCSRRLTILQLYLFRHQLRPVPVRLPKCQAKADVNMPEPDIGVTPLIAAALNTLIPSLKDVGMWSLVFRLRPKPHVILTCCR